MIEIKSLSKKFGDHWALKKTSWLVQDKRSLGLLGPNGAGKSTTMKIMTGLLCSTEGQVLIDGEDILKDPVAVKKKIGYLPETPPLYEELKVYDYFDFICGLKSVERKSRPSQIDNSIEKLNLQEVAFKPIRVLSKGFRQRVGIAQTLIGNPSILILDEPSVGLDPHQVFELRNIIKGLKKDHIIVLSTHILSEVQQICDDVVILDKGVVKSKGSLKELLKSKKSVRVVSIELKQEDELLVQELKSFPKVQNVTLNQRNLEVIVGSDEDVDLSVYLDLIIKKGNGVLSINQDQKQLEDVFIEVTK